VHHVEERLALAMTVPTRALVDPEVAIRPSASLVATWDLPTVDRAALLELGLPDEGVLTPRFQSQREPALVPNVAGRLERRWVDGSERLYDLGLWGGHGLAPHVGVVAGSGQVLAIRSRPLTAADLHPQLQPLHPTLYHPSVAFINSSLRLLVEVAWRWRAAAHILREAQELLESDSWAEDHEVQTRLDALNETVLSHIARLDPGIDPRDESGLWAQLVRDPGY
jgi:hypothetical protein